MPQLSTLQKSAGHFRRVRTNYFGRGGSAFSLVELLVVIAVVAILAALGIPAIKGTLGVSEDSKDRRNAQHLASLSTSIVSSGNPGTNSVDAWITWLTNGVTVTNSFGETIAEFRSDGLGPGDIEGLRRFIGITNSQLVYLPEGTN